MRIFENWFSTFRPSIADYDYYIEFKKVHKNVDGIKVELNILNSLVGSKNVEVDFDNLIRKYPEVLKCIPLLLAVRADEIYAIDRTVRLNIILKNRIFLLNNIRYLCVKQDFLI